MTAFDIGPGGALSGRRDTRRGLPNSGVHSLRYIAVGPDSRLYVSFGSPCNICQPGGLQGTIVSMDQNGSDLRRVAWGVRNSVGFDSRGGTMFFTDNGADRMGDNVPPDELNEHLRTVIVAPMTTSGTAYPWRPRCRFHGRVGFVALDQLRTVDAQRLLKTLGRLDSATVDGVLDRLQEMFAK